MNIYEARTLARTVDRYDEIETIIDRLTANSSIILTIRGDSYITEFNIPKDSLIKEGIKEVLSKELYRLTEEKYGVVFFVAENMFVFNHRIFHVRNVAKSNATA